MTTKTPTTPAADNSGSTEQDASLPVPPRIERWCRGVLNISARRALRPKRLQPKYEEYKTAGCADAFSFFIVKGGRSSKPLVKFEGTKVSINNKFFGPKGGFRKGITKDERSELKAALYSAFAFNAVGAYSKPYYRMMVRCTWKGNALGALNSEKPAREVLQKKSAVKVVETPTGKKEQAALWCLTCAKNQTIEADIFIANGSIKIARGECPDCHHKLRMMLKGAKALTGGKTSAAKAAPAKPAPAKPAAPAAKAAPAKPAQAPAKK
jgi:hypothetical protein